MRSFKKRGQVSIEYLAIFAVAALMIMPLVIIFVSQTSNIEADIAYAQSESAVLRIVASAEEVYFQGTPAKKTLRVQFPKGLQNVSIKDNRIAFILNTVDGEFVIAKDSIANISGTLDTFSGVHILVFEAQEDSVLITEKS